MGPAARGNPLIAFACNSRVRLLPHDPALIRVFARET